MNLLKKNLQMDKRNIFTLVLILLIVILAFVIIFRKPAVIDGENPQEQIWRDSLSLLQSQRDSSLAREAGIQARYDSLLTIDVKTIHHYHEKLIYVKSANIGQLDSVIRSSWRTDL